MWTQREMIMYSLCTIYRNAIYLFDTVFVEVLLSLALSLIRLLQSGCTNNITYDCF